MKKDVPIVRKNIASGSIPAFLQKRNLPILATVLLIFLVSFNASACKIGNRHKTNKKAPAIAAPTPPTVSYSGPQAIIAGSPIAPITPTSTGVAAFGYNNTPFAVGSGFTQPRAVVSDNSGNIFISDNNSIMEIPAGSSSVITYATGFNGPRGLAVDAAGNLYIADANNNAIKEIPAGGGNPIVLLANGLNFPNCVAVDMIGNVFIGDGGNHEIKLLPKTGGPVAILVYPGDLEDLRGMATDQDNNLYFADDSIHYVFMQPANGASLNPYLQIHNPSAFTSDNLGNGYITDDKAKTLTIKYKGGGSNTTLAPGFTLPASITVDPAGNLFIADAAAIKKMAPSGGYYISPALPAGLTFDRNTGIISGTATVGSPARNYTITAYNSTGSASAVINLGVSLPPLPTLSYASPKAYQSNVAITPFVPTGKGVGPLSYSATPSLVASGFNNPVGIVVDAAGNIYVADGGNNLIKKILPDGTIVNVTIAGSANGPIGLAIDAAGNLYIANINNTTIQEIPANGGPVINLGSGFKNPQGVVVDSFGDVYVSDTGNKLVKMIPAGNGAVVTVATGFSDPEGLAIDADGNVFVADDVDRNIREIPAGGGTPVTIVANGNIPFHTVALDAVGNKYGYDFPNQAIDKYPPGGGTPTTLGSGIGFSYGLAVDRWGNVFVAASEDNNIKVIKPFGGYYLSQTLPDGLIFNGSTGAISGTPLGSSHATNYTVTAYNAGGSTQAVVNISVIAANAFLSALTISDGTLTPSFLPTSTAYSASVGYGVTSMTVTPTASEPTKSVIMVNGSTVASGVSSKPLGLAIGQNIINIPVTNTRTTVNYSVTVNRAGPSTNAYLSAIAINKGALFPAFAQSTAGYTDIVSNGNASITITPTLADNTASITVNSIAVQSGHASGAIALNVGSNLIPIVVTAQDGISSQTYTVNVIRPSTNSKLVTLKVSSGSLSPVFSQNTIAYRDAVLNAVSSITLTPTVVVPGATVTVNGTAVTSGSPSSAVSLTVGANAIAVKVTAQDGVTTTTYTVNVTRNPASANDALAGLTISKGTLSPAFAPATTTYTDMVSNGNGSVTVTPKTADATATIMVNGVTVASGAASGAIALSVGSNNIAVVVTAQDGAHVQTYNINVIRPSTNAKLVTLKLSTGALTPAFNSNTTGYTASVDNDVASLTITPTTEVTSSTIRVNGAVVLSGNPSGAIALNVGDNTITTLITAQDGVTTDTYNITVTRAMPGDNTVYEPVGVEKPAEKPSLINDGITVHEGLSPNGDGINDFLQIDNISNFPDNKLTIMNRNGMLVFEMKGYDNNARVFEGHSNKNGQMQLPGTYFYQLDYTVSGTVKHKTGFIVLKY